MEVGATSTAATAGSRPRPAVRQTAISSALRQRRQLRQGYLISCEEPLVCGAYRQSYIRQLLKTSPTLPALPFRSNIRGLRTAGWLWSPAKAAVASALKRHVLHGRPGPSTTTNTPNISMLPAWVTSSGSVCLRVSLIIEALASTCGRDT
jgi:hypothetical protein